jgi:hypothetical protein
MRSGPSATDQKLLAELERRGVQLSPTRLERWRGLGLIARPEHVHLGRHGSATVFETALDTVADQVAAVAARRRRGVPAAITAVQVTADGWPVADALLEEGYKSLLGEILGALEALVGAARQPAYEDDLEVAERITDRLLSTETKLTRSWTANLAATPALLAEGPVSSVLGSAVTAMAQLLIGDDPHDEAVGEMAVAIGVSGLVDDTAGELDPTLVRQGFAARPILGRLRAVQDADAASIRAAGDIMTSLWLVLEHLQPVPPEIWILKSSGDDPHMFALGVAVLLPVRGGQRLRRVRTRRDRHCNRRARHRTSHPCRGSQRIAQQEVPAPGSWQLLSRRVS